MDDRTMVESAMPAYGAGGDATRVMTAPPMGGMGFDDRTQAAIVTTCPICQTPNPPTERYCQDCGLLFGSTPDEVEPLADIGQIPRLVDNASGREHPINPGLNTVGRESSDVLLADPTVSRRHAQITLEGGQLIVEDLGSTNGSFVGGRRLATGERATANDGDAVRFGSIQLSLAIPGGVARAGGGDVSTPAAAAVPEERGAPVAHLVLGDGTEFALFAGTNTIGRRSGNQIVLSDAFMSGKHAEVQCEPDGTCVLVDTGSTNGTFYNGERLSVGAPLALPDGTIFTMGKTPVTVRVAATPLPANMPGPGEFLLPDDATVAMPAAADTGSSE